MPFLLSLLAGSLLALTPGQLLAKYEPVMMLHPQERFAPAPVAPYLAATDLVAGRYDVRGCVAKDGPAATDCYGAAVPTVRETTYGAVFRQGKRTALQYWLFYAYNIWSPLVPPSQDFWQAHEGDWEVVTVLLDERGQPTEVGTSRHCSGARRSWAKVGKRGGRPVVYVGLGSHANYFAPGTYTLEPRCWPSEAVAIYKAYEQPMLDHAGRGRSVLPKLVPVTATAPAWMSFRGAWGADQYAGFPGNVFHFGSGPEGPAFHGLWRKPFATVAAWPSG